MGEIHADVTLENAGDREYFRRGDRAEADIRRATVDGIVDTGAVTLVLPQNVVERLGLATQGTAFVAYADGFSWIGAAGTDGGQMAAARAGGVTGPGRTRTSRT